MRRPIHMRLLVILVLVFLPRTAKAQSAGAGTPPWNAKPLGRTEVPAVYLQQWNRAANRNTCALFAFAQLGKGAGATARAATFSGGWAVAYDRPGLRSAFGIAGTSSSASDSTYEWPNHRRWSDGSNVGYGPEGGTGPDQLAYLRIDGQGCLYNVWSKLGREHLELLLDALRRVAIDTPREK